MLPLLMGVCIKSSFLGTVPAFIFSFCASFCAFFFSNSSCLQFSSCARANILTKLSRVDTTTGKIPNKLKEKIRETPEGKEEEEEDKNNMYKYHQRKKKNQHLVFGDTCLYNSFFLSVHGAREITDQLTVYSLL